MEARNNGVQAEMTEDCSSKWLSFGKPAPSAKKRATPPTAAARRSSGSKRKRM